ncbi:serine/threonine protein kinase [Planctomycetes bacterium Pan216]|uniref:Serine/threonine protein kinase n=1 Tax=Kolteria novifilia TaxID=2527975 RepID=A0A518B7B5_9BACT|nr:serine/threonine protein kinase [Planctomycetes bacterium Pan216]
MIMSATKLLPLHHPDSLREPVRRVPRPANRRGLRDFDTVLRDEWSIDPESCRPLRHGQNLVFTARDREGNSVIVRATSPSHRSLRQLEAELDWVAWLDLVGVPVGIPIETRLGKLAVSVHDEGELFHVSCFHRIDGTIVSNESSERWTDDFIRLWGRMIGRVHRWTERYQPTGQSRYHWHEQPEWRLREKHHDLYHPGVLERIDELVARLKRTPRGRSYQVIHADAFTSNFLMRDDDLILFDFDQSMYCWRLYDLLVAFQMQYVFSYFIRPELNRFSVEEFWRLLLDGYREAAELDREELQLAESLLRLRQAVCYLVSKPEARKWAIIAGTSESAYLGAMRQVEESLLSDQPLLPVDLAEL